MLAFLGLTHSIQGATNDLFANRIEIIGTNAVAGSNVDATMEPGEPAGFAPFIWSHSVWYTWTAPTNGTVAPMVRNETGICIVNIYRGNALDALVRATNAPGFAVTQGEHLEFQVCARSLPPAMPARPGIFTLDLRFQVQLVMLYTNDFFTNRTVLTGTNVTEQSYTIDATTEPGEFTGSGDNLLEHTVWYSWTAPTNGVLRWQATTPTMNFLINVAPYRGASIESLAPLTNTVPGGIVVGVGDSIELQVGSAYHPSTAAGGGTGPFTFNLNFESCLPTSENDAFSNRLEITAPAYQFDGSIYNATSEPGEPLPALETRQSLWWKFIAPGPGVLQVTASATPFAVLTRVYEGNNLDALAPLPSLATNLYRVDTGREYAVQAASDYVAAGHLLLDARFFPQTNDWFAGSELLEGTNWTYYGNYTSATPEPGEPAASASNTVWASWSAPFTGQALVTPQLINSQTLYFSIFTGSTLDQLPTVRMVEMGNGASAFLARTGTVYHFQFCGNGDSFALSLQLQPLSPGTNDNFADAPIERGHGIYFPAKSVETATMEPGEPLHLGDVPQKSLWWNWQAPHNGSLTLSTERSLATNVFLAVYLGHRLDSLRLVGNGTNTVCVPIIAGLIYHIAAVVPVEAVGDVCIFAQPAGQLLNMPLSGNLLQEPSWEGTAILHAQYWKWAKPFGGGLVNEYGGAHGTTWPVLGTGGSFWQDIPTEPGHEYAIMFAERLTCGKGDSRVGVLWDGEIVGTAEKPATQCGIWHWEAFSATASNAVTRLGFTNLAVALELDAFSVIDLTAPPAVAFASTNASTQVGGSVLLQPTVMGTPPMDYQWLFNDTPLEAQTSPNLLLSTVTPEQAGQYRLAVSNEFGQATSAPLELAVEVLTNATILIQPRGGLVSTGSYFYLSVVAAGLPPLHYQWFKDSQPVPAASNRCLVFTNFQATDAGRYEAQVQNDFGSVWSMSASLGVATNANGGGLIYFLNRAESKVYDIDNTTPLAGNRFVAQLYAGPSLDALRPAGPPTPFRAGPEAGCFVSQVVTLGNVAPNEVAMCQVRAWESAYGLSYEEARAMGGKFGKSALLGQIAGPRLYGQPLDSLKGIPSFSLQAGLPYFSTGTINGMERKPDGNFWFTLQGVPGSRYVVEKSIPSIDNTWRPLTVLTNQTGSVFFNDPLIQDAKVVLFRARILD